MLVAIYITILMMNIFFYLPRRATRVLLVGFRVVLRNALVSEGVVQAIPKDPSTILRFYDLDPRTRTYVCCPACYKLYPYSNVDTYVDSTVNETSRQDSSYTLPSTTTTVFRL